jgi:hypothetical protein
MIALEAQVGGRPRNEPLFCRGSRPFARWYKPAIAGVWLRQRMADQLAEDEYAAAMGQGARVVLVSN